MPSSVRKDGSRPKILHVEDNPENRMLVRAILEAEGYTIIDAEDGLTGIEAAIREEPALILLDVNLPAVDGYEVVSIIKSFPAFATTPVIAVTAYAMEGDRQRTLVAGCDGYIQKPIDVDAFPRQVAEFLHGKREHVEEREQGLYLRELNQRLVYRLVNQVEELKRLNQHFVRRAAQLADLHRAVQDITSELGVQAMLEQLLPNLSRALGTSQLAVDIADADVHVEVAGAPPGDRPRSVLARSGVTPADDWAEAEWRLPLTVRGRAVGQMKARLVLPPGAKADEEQLLNIVANQVAIAVENSRLYDGVLRRAAEQQSLVEAGHLLASTLKVEEVLQRFTELVRTRLRVDVARIWLHEETQLRLRHTETLVTVSQAVGATLDLSEVLRRATREMVRALGGDTGVAWLVTPGTEQLVPLVGYHVPKDLVAKASSLALRRDTPFFERLRAHGTLAVSDSASGEWNDMPMAGLIDHKSILIQPMFWKGHVMGGFTVLWSRDRHRFSSDEMRLAEGIALQGALAVENSRLFEGVKEQMDELKRTQAQLVQSTKLAAIGELAANIAHEINNPLTTVLGFASFLAERIAPTDPMREELGLIQEEASRARDIVRDLLQFSRQRDFSPESADVNTVLEQVIAMVRRQGALNVITVDERYEPDLPAVELDVSRIKQVFLNIINNAVYVMPNGGSLTVRTETANGGVRIAFADTGPGIAPEHRDRIFDPFFTTKPEVSGTGLGLSVSLGIVQSHGGTIEVETEVGRGTTFTVALPLRLEDESAERS